MTFTDILIVVILLAVIVTAVLYIRKEKKRGIVCVGCPYAKDCAKKRSGNACSAPDIQNKK